MSERDPGMSRGAWWRAGAALVWTLALCSRWAAAQDIAPIEERIRRLQQREAELNAQAEAMAAAERERWITSLDSMRVGPLRILTPPELTDVARRGAALAWTALTDRLGDSAAMLVHEQRFVVIEDAVTDTAHADLRTYSTLGILVLVPRVNRETQVAMNILVPVYQTLWRRLDRDLQTWIGAPLTPQLDPGIVTPGSYIELATSGSPVAIRCYQGNLPECGEALGLFTPDDPATTWYSADGRRELVARLGQVMSVGADREVYARCVAERVDADCLALMRANPTLIPPPLSGAVRGGALLSALRTGGSGSLERLLHSSPDSAMAFRLQQAGGADLAALLSQWRTNVMAMRPRATQIQPVVAWTSVVWMMTLLLLAFRSSRWR